ncbi:diol dehydratase reactivase [Mycolicibacterium fluoranthenivorans]|uniref:Diol dehydratase reactivase n=1 Tax=Mycolicibacterium fluoranthenivorans TaxID=258505 RepID=A0A7G8PIL1_9MYCO|nr:diol dehydratase reactivase ATPase-like domain-containing protein [Mycolicibacterium fluoranthenivorans]QNJ94177.1 diol dehydratase reactivase [Mycolicibacterium fluoranthenivorans]
MKTIAGIDIGNHTTEIVLARVGSGRAEPLAHGQAPTRGRKGSRDSLEGAAALLTRIEVDAGVAADRVVLSAIRPVDTATAPLPPAASPRSPVISLRRPDASTPAGTGYGVGRHVPVHALTGPVAPDPVVVSIGPSIDYEEAAQHLCDAVAAGWTIAGVLAAEDDAVLIANRIPIRVPVVDEADTHLLDPDVLVAVEVVADGSAYRLLADPVALAAALQISPDELPWVAEFTRELADAPAIAVTRRTRAPEPPANEDDYVDCVVRGETVRFSPEQAYPLLRTEPPGTAVRVRLRSCKHAEDGVAVDDAYFTDLAAIDNGAWLRRGVADTRGAVVALLAADHVADAAETMTELTGRPAHTLAAEPAAAARGALTTPGLPDDVIVCDIGGGTVDLVGAGRTVTAAGAGETITSAVARVLSIPRALAERVKRSPALRVEGPHLAHEEDGRRVFLDTPATADAIGRLCTRGSAGLVPFSRTLAAEEWRSLRLAVKEATVASNIVRCLRVFDRMPAVLVLAGGGALDDELIRTVGEALRGEVVVGRAHIDGVHGPRYAVASGLVHLAAEQEWASEVS